MAVAAVLATVGLFGCAMPVASVALVGAVLVLIILPGWATAHALLGDDAEADRADELAAAFGGVAVATAALWITGVTVGLSRLTILGAPICTAFALVALGPADPTPRAPAPSRFATLLLLAVVFALLVAVPFFAYGRERADGVHHMGLSDWYLHLMMTTALDGASSLPPSNPYLFAHHHAHYHYGFHLLAAAIHRAAGRPIDIFPLLLGLTMLTAAAYPLVLFSLARRRLGGDAHKALVAAAGGTLLAGFDLVVWASDMVQTLVRKWPLPLNVTGLRLLVPSAHLHSWIPVYERQFNSPYVALLWAPHYVAALLTALLCIHALRNEVERPPRFAAALMLAALPGLSAYVLLATVVAVGALVFSDVAAVGGRPWVSPAAKRWTVAGLGALLLATPILASLKESVGQHVEPLVAHVSSVGTLRNGAIFTSWLGDRQWTRLLDTPALLLFQLGMIGLLGALGVARRLRERRWDDLSRGHAAAALAVLVFLVVFRPPLGMDNNLGFRPMLLVWSLLVPFAAEAWFTPARFVFLRWSGVAVCAAALPYAMIGATLEGWLFRPTPPGQVAVARWINDNRPLDSVVAVDPEDHPRDFDLFLRRPLIEAEHRRNAFMLGAPPDEFESIRRELHDAYASLDGPHASKRFRELGADVVVARVDETGALPWPELPCFRDAYRNGDLAVLVWVDEACDAR
jgi:hypothetical protein